MYFHGVEYPAVILFFGDQERPKRILVVQEKHGRLFVKERLKFVD